MQSALTCDIVAVQSGRLPKVIIYAALHLDNRYRYRNEAARNDQRNEISY